MKRFLTLLLVLVAVSFVPAYAMLAADPPAKAVCRCGPACKCNPCACDREPEGEVAANSPLANGVNVAMLMQDPNRLQVEDRFKPPPSIDPRSVIEKKQIEGLLSWLGEFVNGFVQFVMVWQWFRASLWIIPVALFALSGAIVLAAIIIRTGMNPKK